MLRFVPAANFSGTPGGLEVRGLDNTFDPENFTIGPDYRHPINIYDYIYGMGLSGPISGGGPGIMLSTAVAPVADHATLGGDATGDVWEDGIVTDVSGNFVSFDFEVVAAHGTLAVQDPDSGESYFRPASGEALQGLYGTFAFDTNTGEWTYELDHDLANHLYAGQVEYDTLTVTSADGTATEDIVVTIRGARRAGCEGGNPVRR